MYLSSRKCTILRSKKHANLYIGSVEGSEMTCQVKWFEILGSALKLKLGGSTHTNTTHWHWALEQMGDFAHEIDSTGNMVMGKKV